jgi:hypothetical protein
LWAALKKGKAMIATISKSSEKYTKVYFTIIMFRLQLILREVKNTCTYSKHNLLVNCIEFERLNIFPLVDLKAAIKKAISRYCQNVCALGIYFI